MNVKKIGWLFGAMFFSSCIFAQKTMDRIELKDGRILSGYILCEDFAKKRYEIWTVNEQKEMVSFKDLVLVEQTVRDDIYQEGLVDIIKTHDGKIIKGQLVATVMGKGYRVMQDDGTQAFVSAESIHTVAKETIHKGSDIFALNPYSEVIKTKDGNEYNGLIVKTAYPSDGPEVRCIKQKNGKYAIVNSSDIISITYLQKGNLATTTKKQTNVESEIRIEQRSRAELEAKTESSVREKAVVDLTAKGEPEAKNEQIAKIDPETRNTPESSQSTVEWNSEELKIYVMGELCEDIVGLENDGKLLFHSSMSDPKIIYRDALNFIKIGYEDMGEDHDVVFSTLLKDHGDRIVDAREQSVLKPVSEERSDGFVNRIYDLPAKGEYVISRKGSKRLVWIRVK